MKKYFSIGLVSIFVLIGFFSINNDVFACNATVSATKIICDNEADLPNWGAGGADIDSSTVSKFLSISDGCSIEPWTFEWASTSATNPGDQVSIAGGSWTSFASTTVSPVHVGYSGANIWVREQANEDYIPFTGLNTTQDISAEFYCNTDVLNYDNFDSISVVEGGNYFCVGFNVLTQPENTSPTANAGPDQIITLPTNSVTLDGSGSSDSDGTIASYVWTYVSGPSTVDPLDTISTNAGGLVAGTYVFQLTVTDDDGATGIDTMTVTVNPAVINPQCNDDIDNSDEEDTLVDALDPGCHTDGNASNSESYNPNDNDETDVPACSNSVDDDSDELIDALDPGCHSDGNASNSESYVPSDNDENSSPIANAGPDQTITLPTNSVTLNGSGTDSDGTIVLPYVWSFVSGPSIVDPLDTISTNAGGLVAGTYVFQLTVTDDDGATGTDTVSITVNPAQTSHSSSRSGSGFKSTQQLASPAVEEGRVLGASTCGLYLTTFMKLGSKDNDKDEVIKLQMFLNEYLNSNLVVDGIYGPKTYNAVKVFQLKHANEVLEPWVSAHYLQSSSEGTGWMYKTTQRWINMIKCPELNLPMPTLVID